MLSILNRMSTYAEYITAPLVEKKECIERIYNCIINKGIQFNLIHNKEVIQWLFGDNDFLHTRISGELVTTKTKSRITELLKSEEDKWGRETLHTIRPDLRLDKQWTNRFGEYLCSDLYTLQGYTPTKPPIKDHYQPDLETASDILEAKIQTYYTTGTACEKVLGTPLKYAEVPRLYGKPLTIVCMAGAEMLCRNQYKMMGTDLSPEKEKIINYYKDIMRIKYIGATDILLSLE
jgi:hypothetical protein